MPALPILNGGPEYWSRWLSDFGWQTSTASAWDSILFQQMTGRYNRGRKTPCRRETLKQCKCVIVISTNCVIQVGICFVHRTGNARIPEYMTGVLVIKRVTCVVHVHFVRAHYVHGTYPSTQTRTMRFIRRN